LVQFDGQIDGLLTVGAPTMASGGWRPTFARGHTVDKRVQAGYNVHSWLNTTKSLVGVYQA